MANITDPRAIAFCDNRVRVAADQLCQAYYSCVALGDRWVSLGSDQAALDQMQLEFRKVAERLILAHITSLWSERNWNNGISSLFPNDTSPVFDGVGAQDPKRPALTGAKVTNVIVRCQEFQNWHLSIAGSFTAIPQVETATAAGTITGTGNATVIVTAYGMTNSPKTVSVAVTNADTASTWAGKVRTALAADVDVGAFFTISGATTAVTLTAKTAVANDPTMNCSLANGTSTGITAAPTSANTTAGVATRGGVDYINTILIVGNDGPATVGLTDAGNFVNRANELKTNYQASSNANLNTLLAAAVNPNNPNT